MSYITNKNLNYYLEISKENIQGTTNFMVIGKNDATGTSEREIWDGNTSYTYISVANALQIVSTSIDDTVNGDGIRTLKIVGLDSNYNEISEVVNLNGITPVTTVNSYLRINYMIAITNGILLYNQGIITASIGSTVYAQINIGFNKTLSSIYTIPAGKSAYVVNYIANTGKLSDVEIRNYAKPFNNSAYVHFQFFLYQNSLYVDLTSPPKFEEKTDLSVKALTSTGTQPVSVAYYILLVDN